MVMSIMLGTVFFALIQNSIDYGFRTGIYIASGVIASDIILIIISLFGASLIPEGGKVEFVIRAIGAVFLMTYGLLNLRKKKEVQFPETTEQHKFQYFALGFVLNIINPANLFWWIAVSANLKAVAAYSTVETGLYYTGALSGIFGVEVLIAYLATTLKKFITKRFLRNVDIVVGILFIGFSIPLFWPVVNAWLELYR